MSGRLYQLLDRGSHLQQQSCYRLLRDFEHSDLLRLPQLGFGFALSQIIERLKARGERHSTSVTDLVALRPAYYVRVRPDIVPDLDRQELMMLGSGFHEQFGRAVAA